MTMPTKTTSLSKSVTVKIQRVGESPTRVPGLRAFTIDAAPDLERPETLGLQFQTVDAWKATLCDRARQTGRPVRVTWKRTTYGKTLTKVQFVERT
jgi:translation initiation factor 1 (eIF-1/SUI1)